MKKRILSIALAVLMVLALLPSAALAADADEVDYSPYVKLIRILCGEATDVMYGDFVDFDGDGVSEVVLTYPSYSLKAIEVWTLTTNGDGTPGYKDLFRGYYEYSGYNHSDDWTAVIENDRGELGLFVHSETVFTSSDPAYEGLINPNVVDKVYFFRDGRFVLDEKATADVWQTVPDKNGNSYYYPDVSTFSLESRGVISGEEYDAWFAQFSDSVAGYAYLSPTEPEDGLTALEMLYLLQTGFIDVPTDQYYADPVVWALENGITNGTGDLQFSPEAPCTRGQIVTFLWRANGSPEPKSASNPFVDVKTDDYFYKAVLWAVEQGITNGMDETHFGPDVPCTRAHVVTFLWRSHNKPAAGGNNPFSDVPADEYYTDAVLWAVKNEITNGMDATHFGPDNTCTRGQIVTFLYRDLAE